jgi:hypothetical protein
VKAPDRPSDDGLPVWHGHRHHDRAHGAEGATIAAPPFGEERLLAVVAAYQAVTDHHLRRPPDPTLALAGPSLRSAAPFKVPYEEQD